MAIRSGGALGRKLRWGEGKVAYFELIIDTA